MNQSIWIGLLLVVALGATGWMNQSKSPAPTSLKTEDSRPKQTQPQVITGQPLQQATTQRDATAGWKTFVNSRDGYSVKYPNEEIAGTPSVNCCSDLTSYGFTQSLSFMRYGGWADIYIFNGSITNAIAASKTIDSKNRVYGSVEDRVMDGKNGKVVSWTNKLDSSSRVSYSYFVEYQPGKTLYISGREEFVSTIKFLQNTSIQTPAVGTKEYKGAWFKVSYPQNFIAKAEGADEASFTLPDSSIQFYVYSPQWSGNPVSYLQAVPTEFLESDTSTTSVTSITNSYGTIYTKKVTRYVTYAAKDGSYTRSLVSIISGHVTSSDSENYAEKTHLVFGIKYKDKVTYDKYLEAYLAFKKSLTQYAD